ncbi:MAG TPA: putative baseplate assembly protein [Trichocoleus sp.]|jgi:hypothetical protein
MNPPALTCQLEQRRHRVQTTPHLVGLDYLEVSANQRTLTVYFLGKAPETIAKSNVRIDGGRRIQNIRVLDIEVIREDDPELDDAMQVNLDRPGDFSDYQLRLVATDEYGQPTDQPLPGVDPHYDQISFNFKVGCPSDLDCKQPTSCPEPQRVEPEISYLAKDYASFRQLLLDRLSLIMPEWQERHIPDLGIAVVELLAYVGDYLSYYQDAVATEAYLGTARQRISVRRHARLMDYLMHEGCNARAWVCLKLEGTMKFTLDPQDVYLITGCNDVLPVSGHTLSAASLKEIPADRYEVFEPMATAPIDLYAAHNELYFYTWGDRECCLPKGATAATLKDEWTQVSRPHSPNSDPCACDPTPEPPSRQRKLHLQPGDILILEEVMGPKTGNPADADPKHRHVVRLTRVEPGVDALYNQPIVEIEWAVEEALPFALCISAIGPAPHCKYLNNISVARGNVILVDHGRSLVEPLGKVEAAAPIVRCEGVGLPADTQILPKRFAPQLQEPALTYRQPLVQEGPAMSWLRQDPHQALPNIKLAGIKFAKTANTRQDHSSQPNSLQSIDPKTLQWRWMPQFDLLSSHQHDRHFIVEMDNDRRAQLRFGDGELGQQPAVDAEFYANYRVGNGLAGNVGAETISHLVFRNSPQSGIRLTPRNPLPAIGGAEPEPLEEVKLFAPQAFRRKLERAITPDDYARLAETYHDAQGRRVQRAAATLRWTGSWYEVVIAIDPLGQAVANPDFLEAIAGYLHRYRRIGYSLRVVAAHYVPIDLAMTVCVLPHYLRGQVKAALLDQLSNRQLSNGTQGFFHPDRLSFGDSIAISKLVAAVLSVEGVESAKITTLNRLNQLPNQELETGILPLASHEIAQLDNDPSFPEQGKLTLNLRGGR